MHIKNSCIHVHTFVNVLATRRSAAAIRRGCAQSSATRCNTYDPLRHAALHMTHCNTLQHTAVTLQQHTASNCTTL